MEYYDDAVDHNVSEAYSNWVNWVTDSEERGGGGSQVGPTLRPPRPTIIMSKQGKGKVFIKDHEGKHEGAE